VVGVQPCVKFPWANSIMLDLLGEIKPKGVRKERFISFEEGMTGQT